MAYHLCSSPSFLFRNPQTPSRSLPSSSSPTNFRLLSLAINTHRLSFLQCNFSQEPLCKYTMFLCKTQLQKKPRTPKLHKLEIFRGQMEIPGLSRKAISGSIPAAPEVHSCGTSPTIPGLGDYILEPNAVVVLNSMNNPENALLALNYFQQRLKPKREVILDNVTLKVCRKGKDMERAEKLFDEILQRGVNPDNVTFSTMISCSLMCSLLDKDVEWFEKIPGFGCNSDYVTYLAMIDAYGRAGKVEMAFSLYDRARTEKRRIDPVTFSTFIKIHGQSGNFDGCLNVYEELKAIGAKPNLVIYNTLLDAMGRARRPWQAKKIY
ncbi:hypothetical protein FF1_005358 [Malus domestica]